MTSGKRDRILILILPAMAAVLGYGLLFHMPQQSELTRLAAGLKKAADGRPPAHDVHAKQLALFQIQAEVGALKREAETLARAWNGPSALSLAHGTRADRLTRLLALLNKHDVHVVHHGPMEGTNDVNKDIKLTKSHEQLLKLLSERNGKQVPQAWRLRLAGRYGDVAQALEGMNSGEPLAIPLGVVMKEASPPTGMHEWWIYLWM